MNRIQKVVLIILDGWGIAPAWGGNAVELAETFNFDNYWRKYPHTTLKASEEAVGLPHHEPGNSEVGHLNIGSGRIVRQNLAGITKEIEDGTFFENKVLKSAIDNARKNNSNIHLFGLVSDGGVHSHIYHLFALLDLIKKEKFDRVYIHMVTDSRDTGPMKALSYLEKLEGKIRQIGIGKVASVMGRFYAFDRDNRWDRIEKCYNLLSLGVGSKSTSPERAISEAYRNGDYDEFIKPVAIENQDSPFVPIKNKDSVILFNFRADRTKEITWAFVKKHFNNFSRKEYFENLYFATFAFHEEIEEKLPVEVVFRPSTIVNSLAEVLKKNNLSQFHIAETEKYAHVTYFFDGGKDQAYEGEKRILVPSPKVATYDLKPEMNARRITDEVLENYEQYDFTVVNFANPDMVGHTGNLKAAILACEEVDVCVGKIVKDALENDRVVIITADHGNAEQMLNPNTGEPHTEHTINPVPFVIVSEVPRLQSVLKTGDFAISDIAPTILRIMDIGIPHEMTGQSLVE